MRQALRAYDLAVLVSMVTVVRHSARLPAVYLSGFLVIAGAIAQLVVTGALTWSRHPDDIGGLVLTVSGSLVLWLVTYVLRTRSLLIASLRERAATAERERDHLHQLTMADERAAIARELHDVVAHSLAVMIVQADGAAYGLPDQVEQARTVLGTISAVGRDALGDMHRIVDVLRGTGASPEPRREDLDALAPMVERARSAGLEIALDVEDPPCELSPSEELTILRLVQECLTNTLRHAGPDARVNVRLGFADGIAILEVADNGGTRGAAPGEGGPVAPGASCGRPGSGVIGMRERVNALGGQFRAGGQPGAGWEVSAVFALKAAAR